MFRQAVRAAGSLQGLSDKGFASLQGHSRRCPRRRERVCAVPRARPALPTSSRCRLDDAQRFFPGATAKFVAYTGLKNGHNWRPKAPCRSTCSKPRGYYWDPRAAPSGWYMAYAVR